MTTGGYGYSLDTKSGTNAANDSKSAVGGGSKTVYFGGASPGLFSSAGPVPQWVWVAVAVGAAVWVIKRKF